MKKIFVIVCGVPASGKTAIAKKLKEKLNQDGRNFKILHSDQFKRNTYKRMFNMVKSSSKSWIIDGTFYKKKWREKFMESENVKVVWVKASLETCLKRNRERTNGIEEKAVKIIWK